MSSPTIIRKWNYSVMKPNRTSIKVVNKGIITADSPTEAMTKVLLEIPGDFSNCEWEKNSNRYKISEGTSIARTERQTVYLWETTDITLCFAELVKKERQYQDEKWGKQNHHQYVFLGILLEEVGELSDAIDENPELLSGLKHIVTKVGDVAKALNQDADLIDVLKELIQVAAVSHVFGECILELLDQGYNNDEN